MYRLNMAERLQAQQAQHPMLRDAEGAAHADAERAEQQREPLAFRSTVLVLGLAGVGKTSTIKRILDIDVAVPYKQTSKVCVRGLQTCLGHIFLLMAFILDVLGRDCFMLDARCPVPCRCNCSTGR